MSVWSALNAFYSHLRVLDDDVDSMNDIVGSPLAVSNSVAHLLDRGVKSAEISLDLQAHLSKLKIPSSVFVDYRHTIHALISKANLSRCPSLTSSHWKCVGLMLVDSVLSIMPVPGFNGQSWDELVVSQSARLGLDVAELFMIRDFFSSCKI